MQDDEKILNMQIQALGTSKGVYVYEKTRKDFIICRNMRPAKEILKQQEN